jgi:hypothetical protein
MKILSIAKTNEPWKPEGKKYTLYSWWCTIDDKGQEVKTKVIAFSKKIVDQMKPGAIFDDFEIQQKTNQATGQQYSEYKIATPKSDFQGGAKSYKEKYTPDEYIAVHDKAINYAQANTNVSTENISGILSADSVYQSFVKYAFDHGVKFQGLPQSQGSGIEMADDEFPPE